MKRDRKIFCIFLYSERDFSLFFQSIYFHVIVWGISNPLFYQSFESFWWCLKKLLTLFLIFEFSKNQFKEKVLLWKYFGWNFTPKRKNHIFASIFWFPVSNKKWQIIRMNVQNKNIMMHSHQIHGMFPITFQQAHYNVLYHLGNRY